MINSEHGEGLLVCPRQRRCLFVRPCVWLCTRAIYLIEKRISNEKVLHQAGGQVAEQLFAAFAVKREKIGNNSSGARKGSDPCSNYSCDAT